MNNAQSEFQRFGTFRLLPLALLMASLLFVATQASALIVGPYTADAATLHLYHLDEATTPCIDSVATGGTNLVFLTGGATLGNPGFSTNFGNCLNTAPGGGGKGDLLAASPTAGNVTITVADPTTGAFTFEALVYIGFDPTVNSTTAYEIMAGESGVNANRIFQWRIAPKGFTLIGTGATAIVATNSPFLTFENVRAISGNQATIYAPIPTTGPDAIQSNAWYHIAVTYNGVPNTANNITFYWTLLNTNRIVANALTINSAQTTLSGLNPLSTITTTFMLGNQGRSKNGNFLGSIDEVRISKVARGPAQMMFAPANVIIVTEPATNSLAAVGDNLPLTVSAGGGGTLFYQWQLNGTNLPSAVNPTATNATLVLSNISVAQAGPYQVIVTNLTSGATSTVANVQVGGLITGVFNTGVSDNRTLLPGGSVDPHWQLVQSADATYTGPSAYVVTTPVPQWLPNGANSDWIAPGDGANVAAGDYTYQTTFLLDTLNPTNAVITGNWISDNQGQDIILNGVSLGITNGTSLGSFTQFTITNGFVPGLNTLQCVVTNLPGSGANPSGLRVEMRGVAYFLPPTAPQVLTAPTNISTQTRQTAVFSVAAVGSGPLSYQWLFGTNLLAGQTNRTLVLPDLTTAQSGAYTVDITNSIGSTNASATLTVVQPPALAWLGLVSGDWDTTTTNWLDANSLANVTYASSDDVVFDDRSAVTNINLTAALTPNSVLVAGANSYIFSSSAGGSLTGSFSLTKDGAGSLTLDTPNTYTGSTVILNGTLQVGNGDASGSIGSGPVTNNGALVFDRTDTYFVSSAITGSGSLTTENGTALISGNNSYTGPTVVAAGQLTPRSGTALGTADGGTTVNDGAQLFIDIGINLPAEPFTLGGTGLAGDGALRKGGSTATTLGGPITLSDYAGIQVDSASTLTLTNSAAITSTNSNMAVQCLGTGILNVMGAVDLGSGNITEFGAGIVVLSSANNVWTGGTTITGGTLQVGDGTNSGSIGAGAIADNAILTFNSPTDLNETNAISGSGVVNQNGNGTLYLSPQNSYGGGTKINGLGAIFLTNAASVGTGTVTIGLAQTDISVLKLSGGVVLNNQIAIFPRAFGVTNNGVLNPANIENIDSTNIVNSPAPIVIPTGGNLLTFQCDTGFLSISNGINAGGGGRDLVLKGVGPGEIRGNIGITGAGNSVFIWKLDSGTWTLWGSNAPGAATTISNGTLIVNGSMDTSTVTNAGGTLAGTGAFAGSVVIMSGAKLSPTLGAGVGIGTMGISNTLTLQAGSTTTLQLNQSAGTSDQIVGLSNVVYGGSLVLSNLSGSFAIGNSFPLFSSAHYSGAFAGITPATPGAGLKWNLAGLSVDGVLRVSGTNISAPTITSTTVSGGSLVLSGSGGAIDGSYVLLSSTNLAAHLTTWSRVATNVFDGSGHFTITAPIGSTAGGTFFALQPQ